MSPRMRTRSVGRPATESLGGERVYGLVEVKGVEDLEKVGNQGNVENQNGNVVNENVQENVGKFVRITAMVRLPLLRYTDRSVDVAAMVERGNVGEPSKDKNGRDDNKRTRTRNAFATTVKPCRKREYGLS
ncbi:hypothetical protein Tco_0205312 [Tanacetum coccineum]